MPPIFHHAKLSELFETNHLKMIVDGTPLFFHSLEFLIIVCQNHNKFHFAHIVTIETNVPGKEYGKKSMNRNYDVDVQKCIESVQKKKGFFPFFCR